MTDKQLSKQVTEFVEGLIKTANCAHSGNCFVMCCILQPYLVFRYNMATIIKVCRVKQGRKRINHYYLLRSSDGKIIDGTASQFKDPKGKKMPTVYIGEKPKWY